MDNGQDSYRKPSYNIKIIRAILTEAFSAEELKRFCLDRPLFRPVYERFTQMTGQDLMVDYLLEYCDQKLVFGELLSELREQASPQYDKYGDKVYEAVATERDSPDLEIRYSDITAPKLERNVMSVDIVQILLPKERYPLAGERRALLINLITAVCEAPPDTVQILRIQQQKPNVDYWLAVAIGQIGGLDAKEALDRIHHRLISREVGPYPVPGIEDALKLAESKHRPSLG